MRLECVLCLPAWMAEAAFRYEGTTQSLFPLQPHPPASLWMELVSRSSTVSLCVSHRHHGFAIKYEKAAPGTELLKYVIDTSATQVKLSFRSICLHHISLSQVIKVLMSHRRFQAIP